MTQKYFDSLTIAGLNFISEKELFKTKISLKKIPVFSKALINAKTMGVNPQHILNLCLNAFYSKGRLVKDQVKKDLKYLTNASSSLKETSKVLTRPLETRKKTKPEKISNIESDDPDWQLTKWTTKVLNNDLKHLRKLQDEMKTVATSIDSFINENRFPKNRPSLWNDIKTVYDPYRDSRYILQDSLRVQRFIFTLALLFRIQSKNKTPLDRLALIFVTTTLNKCDRTKVEIDLDTFVKMRRNTEALFLKSF